jgi:tetratricopeptide (TPR) repeat protein
MKRAPFTSQNTLNRIFQDVNEAWKRCEFKSAIQLLESFQRRDPANIDILVNLGRLHGLRYQAAAAEKYFERALRLTSQRIDVLVAIAEQCRQFNHLSLAEGYLKRALEKPNIPLASLVTLGEIYERQRRTDEAGVLADRVLAADATFAPALLLRARLDRQAKKFEHAEQCLRNFPATAEIGFRANAAYELGNILDRQGRYEEAMTAFIAAKALLQPQASRPAYELQVMRNRIRHLTENATAEVLKQWHAQSPHLLAPQRIALLGGHPRSGTTLLEQVLDGHPDIISAEETEVFYNDAYGPLMIGQPEETGMFSALSMATPARLQLSRQQYFQSMDLALNQPLAGRLLIDKNPSYTFLIPALSRIFPEIKLLIALRDPRDVVLSCFMQNLPMNQVGAAFLTLNSTVQEYTDLMSVWQTTKSRMPNPYLEVRYEDMVENLESVARNTLNFLDIPWDASVLGFDQHAREKVVRSPTYADVTQPVYKRAVGRWQHYRKYLEPQLEKLEPYAKAFGYE